MQALSVSAESLSGLLLRRSQKLRQTIFEPAVTVQRVMRSIKAYRFRGQLYSKAANWAMAERDVAMARRAEAGQQ